MRSTLIFASSLKQRLQSPRATIAAASAATVTVAAATAAATNMSSSEGGPITISLSKRQIGQGEISRRAVEGAALSEQEIHEVIKAHLSRLQTKYHANFDRFEANTGTKHPLDKRTAACSSERKDEGTTPLTSQEGNQLWTGEVAIGTPPVRVPLDFDTGSSDLFVTPGLYHPDRSSTCEKTGKRFGTGFGDGTHAEGDIYLEDVTVGGLTAHKQAVGNATKSTLDEEGSKGIAGMAFQKISSFNAPSFIATLIHQSSLAQPVFGFGLWADKDARLDLGHIPQNVFKGDLVWNKADSASGFWAVDFEISHVEGRQVGMVDTGTTLIVGPKADVKAMLLAAGMTIKEQDGQIYGVYRADAPTPELALTFNGTRFPISADALLYQKHGDLLVAGIVGSDFWDEGITWVLGDTLLRDVYAVFKQDGEQAEVGFAPKA
ncbi:hypothetical protein OC835_005929 [Tilletia horrida]|nr:hypothetical protein OC835_005929 [Tilletia horrida]